MRIRETIHWGHPWGGPNKHRAVKIFAVTANSVVTWQQEGQRRSRGSRGEEMGKRTKRVIGALWASDIFPAGEVEECWECVDFTHARPPQKPGPGEGESIGALWRLHVALPPVQTLRLGPEDTHQARPLHTDKNNIHLDCGCESKCPYSTSEYIVSIFQPWALSECFVQWAFINLNTGTENWVHTEKIGKYRWYIIYN